MQLPYCGPGVRRAQLPRYPETAACATNVVLCKGPRLPPPQPLDNGIPQAILSNTTVGVHFFFLGRFAVGACLSMTNIWAVVCSLGNVWGWNVRPHRGITHWRWITNSCEKKTSKRARPADVRMLSRNGPFSSIDDLNLPFRVDVGLSRPEPSPPYP